MDFFLQLWGGLFYLSNKIFLAVSEKAEKKNKWKLSGWIAYLLGNPAWLIILMSKKDWIAAAVEFGGIPSMILGIIIVVKGIDQVPKLFDKIAQIFAYGLLIIGIGYSLYDYGGITAFSQVLEIGLISGYLVGTYLLAKNNNLGWLWFLLMNSSCGTLMLIQNKPLLAIQQAISIGFVIWGFTHSIKNKKDSR